MDTSKVICLIDMDCFYVQVEQIAAPQYLGKPCGVCQYNPYKGGGLIAVNYEARKFNVKRGMRGDQAKELCPEFHAFFVDNKRGKADLTKYREASMKIFEIISKHCDSVEKASIDEAYLDLSEQVIKRLQSNELSSIQPGDLNSSFVVGSYSLDSTADREENLKAWLAPISDLKANSNDKLLAVGALIVEEIRLDIKTTLGYNCSAGIANNKTLAKLCCGLNKPNRQTILPSNAIPILYETTPINKVKNLGGKLGVILNEEMKLKTMSELSQISQSELMRRFGDKTGNWLWQISHGIDTEPVMSRQVAKSIGCSKNFRGKQALNTITKVNYWLKQLSEELQERLDSDKERNQRDANLLVLHLTTEAGTFSKSTNITKYCSKRFAEQALELLKPFNKSRNDSWNPAIVTLGISASKFTEHSKTSNPLMKYFNTKINDKNTADNDKDVEEILVDEKREEEGESSTEPCTSSAADLNESSDNLALLVETMNNNDIDSKISSEPTTSKSANQNNKSEESDESCLDVDENFDNDECVLINESSKQPVTNTTVNSSNAKTNNYFQQPNIENLEETDYVQCEKCSKKILSWFMPEHEDFHYAQELSKELSGKEVSSSINNINNSKKRSLSDDTPLKNASNQKADSTDKNSKKTLITNTNNKNKKPKTENTTKSIKSIDNYFTKLNNK